MTSFLRKCKKVIKTELSYLVLTLFSALLITALSLSTFIVSFSMPVESISRYLEYMPSHTLLNFTYGEVSKTDVDESFYNFFDIVDGKGGNDFKNVSDTYFLNNGDENYHPLVINEFNINCDILLMTSWDLNLYNLNFVFETNSLETKILSSDEIYISDKLADKLLDEGKNYDDLLDTSIDCETMRSSTSSIVNRSFKIKGIVDTDNESSNIIKYKFVDTENLVIMSYPSVVNVFTQLKYCFIMYESFLSINYVLGRITDYVSNHEIYETCIFDYDVDLNQLLIGESNIYYHNTINSHNSVWIGVLLIAILLLLIVFHFGILFQYMIFKHGSYETRIFFYFLTFLIPAIFLVILFLFCPYIISSGIVFSTINSNFIIFYLLLIIAAVPYCYKMYVINVLKNKFTYILSGRKIEERETTI